MLDRLAAAYPAARDAVTQVRAVADADPLSWDALAKALRALSSEIASV